MLALILLLFANLTIQTFSYTASNCPSTIPEWNRIDCYPEEGSNEAGCISRGCMWCESSVQGPPWCFFDDTGLKMMKIEEVVDISLNIRDSIVHYSTCIHNQSDSWILERHYVRKLLSNICFS